LDYLTTHASLSPIRRGVAPGFVNYKKGCTRLAAASDKVYQLLTHGRWFSPGTPASSTTKTGHHDIQNVAEILLKVALKHQQSVDKNNIYLHGYLYKRVPVNSMTYILGHIITYETSYDFSIYFYTYIYHK